MPYASTLSGLLCGAWLVLGSLSAVAQDLELTLGLRQDDGRKVATIDFDESFEVVFRNTSDRPISIPALQTARGVSALSFSIRDVESGQVYHVFRDTSHWKAETGTVEIAPHGSYSHFVSFCDSRWSQDRWQNLPSPGSEPRLTIEAQFRVDKSPSGQWDGQVKSQPSQIEFVFGRAALPQLYLWNGFPDGARRMMEADMSLIHKTDSDRRTPLHVAARFGHEDIVRWLLENGADPNVEAYNRFTPLYMATLSARPEIFRRLLKAGADAGKANAFGKSPLQEVVGKIASAKNDSNRKLADKWNRILEVLLENGATLDLVSAIELGRTEHVVSALSDDASVLTQHQGDQKLLRMAVMSGHHDIAKYLLENHPDHMDVDNFAGNHGYPVIKDALKHNDLVQLLIEHGADLERRVTWQGSRTGVWLIGDNATLLHFAARDGSPETVTTLLDQGVDLFANAQSDLGNGGDQTAPEVAALFGKSANLLAMLSHETFTQADEALKKNLLETCLRLVGRGSLSRDANEEWKMISMLVRHGASPETMIGKSNLIQSVTSRIHPHPSEDNEHVRQLVTNLQGLGIELDFFSAVAIQNTDAVIRMLAKDPSLCEARRVDGYPAIHFAVSRGDLEMVERLLDAGCNIELRNHSRNSGHFAARMIHVAAFWNQPEIGKFLIESGAEVNVITKGRNTPLHLAAASSSLPMVELLLANGADAWAEDIGDRTPLTRSTHPQIKKLLKEHMAQGRD